MTLNKDIILSLIKDDLIHSKLLNGLFDLGFESSSYGLALSESIFILMGIGEALMDDDITMRYFALTLKASALRFSDLDALVEEIYSFLLGVRGSSSLPDLPAGELWYL